MAAGPDRGGTRSRVCDFNSTDNFNDVNPYFGAGTSIGGPASSSAAIFTESQPKLGPFVIVNPW
jgi:hypothetical protein